MDSRCTVIHIITKLELGGAQKNTLDTVTHLNPEKFNTVLIAGAGGQMDSMAEVELGDRFHKVRYLVRPIFPVFDIIAVFQLYKIIRAYKHSAPVVVHTHSSKAGILGRIAARMAKADKIIHSVHGFGITPLQSTLKRRLLLWLEKQVSKITDHFIFVSEANRQQALEWNLCSLNHTSLIHSGIHLDAFEPKLDKAILKHNARESLDLPQNAAILGMVACFKPQKAPLDFIKVARHIINYIPSARFIMVGDGVLRPKIEALIKQLKLQPYVKLLGWRNDIEVIIHAFDIMLLTSLWEGLPQVIPQAFAAHVPVIANAVDGSQDIIQHGTNGLLSQPGDIQGMARLAIELIENPQQAADFVTASQDYLSAFDWNKMIIDQDHLYQDLLSMDR